MNISQPIINNIVQQGMLPLFYYEDAEVSLEIIRTLYRAGIRVIEYTNRGPAALENFKFLKKAQREEMPGLHLGIGTIKTGQEAHNFIVAGADFIISPIVNPAVAKITNESGLIWCPGCMTPTEIYLAHKNGAALVKLFPANILGIGFMGAVKELFPGKLFMPTGGVEMNAGNINEWFKAGVCAVGMGSKLITSDVLTQKLYQDLYVNTIEALKLVQAARQTN